MHSQRLGVVLINCSLADRTTPQSQEIATMQGEHIAARGRSDSAAHVKLSNASWVEPAWPVASSLSGVGSRSGSLSFPPCAKSADIQHAELQHTLCPACFTS